MIRSSQSRPLGLLIKLQIVMEGRVKDGEYGYEAPCREREGDEQLGECTVQQPGNNRQVAALIVRREQDRVLVLAVAGLLFGQWAWSASRGSGLLRHFE